MATSLQSLGQEEATVSRQPSLRERVVLVAIAAAAFATSYWPAPLFRSWVRGLAGHPRYAGSWLVLEHALLYSTLAAGVCLVCWTVLARRGLLPVPSSMLSLGPRATATVAWGLGAAVVAVGLHLALVLLFHRLGYLPGRWELSLGLPSGWKVLGNVFSNFHEEVIYRGFLLVVARTVLRSTALAVAITSLIFGLTHRQYLPLLQLLLAGAGAVMALACVRSQSLWAAWICHQIYDVLLEMAFA